MSRSTRHRLGRLLNASFLTLAAHAALVPTPGLAALAEKPTVEVARKAPAVSGLDHLAEEAAKAQAAGHLVEAVGHYEAALRLRPSWIEGRWALAMLLYDMNRYEQARGHFDALVKARPNDGTALALKGLCEAMLKDEQRAVGDLRRGIRLGIASPQVKSTATFQAAILTNKLGDPEGAFETLRQSAVDGDDRPTVIETFGLITLRLPLAPADIPADRREMVLLAGRAGYDMARARRSANGRLAIDELASRYPAEPSVHYARGMYLLPDDPAAAVEEFRRELAVSPDHHVAMIQIALAELKQGHADVALPFAEKAASLAPKMPAAHVALGRALLALGQVERAVQEMEAAAKLAPEIPRLRYSLAEAYDRAGRKDDAARERSEFVKLRGTTGEPTDAAIEGVPSLPPAGRSGE